MSLRSKIVLILIAVVALVAAIDHGLLRFLIYPFLAKQWEQQEAEEDLAQVQGRIQDEIERLSGKGLLLGDTLCRQELPTPESLGGRLPSDVLERAELDLLYVCDARGNVLWGKIVDPATRGPLTLRDFPSQAIGSQLTTFPEDQEELRGLMMTERWPLFVSSHALRGPDGRSFDDLERFSVGSRQLRRPVLGVVIVGRFLDSELETAIERAAGLKAEAVLLPAAAVGDELRALVDALTSGTAHVTRVNEDGKLHAYTTQSDLRTGQYLLLDVALEREIAARGSKTANYLLLSTLGSGLLILFVLLRLLQRIVIQPLSALTSKAVEIGRRDDTSIRVGMRRDDEVGQLASEFDSMLEKLARSRELVIQTARMAGMSEIATGVLHNVGNVLNSVNVSASLATKRAEQLSTRDLELLVGVLKKHEQELGTFVTQDPKGKHLVPFLTELVRALGTQKLALQEELRSLEQGVEHIAELVRAQQDYAGAKGVFERAVLEEQVEAALRMCGQGVGLGSGIEVVRQYGQLPQVQVDKHKLMEILVNLIRNAGQALGEGGRQEKRLVLRITRAGQATARVEVEDNGVGIPAENITKIFQHGFTTKKDGHGFGLHVSANAATEMGAKLQARSAGPGQGAVFTLDIPMQEEEALVAAA